MRKAAAKVQKISETAKKNIKIIVAGANFSFFTLHFSLLFCIFASDKSIK
jgi:hypothetical protein